MRFFGRNPLPGRIEVVTPIFDKVVLAAILSNTIVLLTSWFVHSELLEEIEHGLLLFFCFELVVKFGRAGWNVKQFFGKKWNLFDFVIIALALLPFVAANIAVLRIARTAHVTHTLRHLSHLRLAHFFEKH